MGLGIVTHFPSVLIILVPTIFSLGMQSTCMTSVMTKVSSTTSVGTVLGVAGSLTSICRALTPWVGGVIMEMYGMLGGMTLVSILCTSVVVGLHWYPASPHAMEIPSVELEAFPSLEEQQEKEREEMGTSSLEKERI